MAAQPGSLAAVAPVRMATHLPPETGSSAMLSPMERLTQLNELLRERNQYPRALEDVADIVGLFRMVDAVGNRPAALLRAGVILATNQRFTEVFGWADEEVVGMPGDELAAPEDRARVAAMLHQHEPAVYECTVIAKSGRRVPVTVEANTFGAFRFSVLTLRE